MANAALIAVDLILNAAGYGEYTTSGMLMDAIFGSEEERNRRPTLTQEQVEYLLKRAAEEKYRKAVNEYGRVTDLETKKYVKDAKEALLNRKTAIANLPTSTDLKAADAARLAMQRLPTVVTPSVTREDRLADTKLRLEKLNNESIVRNQLQATRMKEAKENAAEEQAKSKARQMQLEGSKNLLSQVQNRSSADLAKLKQIMQQQQSQIQQSQAQTEAANAAVIRAEQEQQAKTAQSIPVIRRLPPSVKYGGAIKGEKSVLKRLMSESDMTLKEAKKYIKLYGI